MISFISGVPPVNFHLFVGHIFRSPRFEASVVHTLQQLKSILEEYCLPIILVKMSFSMEQRIQAESRGFKPGEVCTQLSCALFSNSSVIHNAVRVLESTERAV